jgi:bacterioferritin-associated ferredoxin
MFYDYRKRYGYEDERRWNLKMKNKDSEVIICRCEDVTREVILECIADGCESIDEIKCITRAGMGPCQGRTCRNLIAAELSSANGVPLENVMMTSFRPPSVPVSLSILADSYDAEQRSAAGD